MANWIIGGFFGVSHPQITYHLSLRTCYQPSTTRNMDLQSESSVPSSSPDWPTFCLETSASIEEDMDTPGLLDEDTSEHVKQVMKTMNLRPDLLSEYLSFFLCLYHLSPSI